MSAEERERGLRVAAALKRARERQRRAQADLATGAGVPLDTVRRLEGRRVPTPSFLTVARLARELTVPLEELAEAALGPGPDAVDEDA